MTLLRADSGEGTYGDPIALGIRCKSGVTDVLIAWESFLGTDKTTVTHRVGEAPAQTIEWGISTDHTITVYPIRRSVPVPPGWGMTEIPGTHPLEFILELLEADIPRLVVRVVPYGESPITAIFDLTGMENAVEGVRAACGW